MTCEWAEPRIRTGIKRAVIEFARRFFETRKSIRVIGKTDWYVYRSIRGRPFVADTFAAATKTAVTNDPSTIHV